MGGSNSAATEASVRAMLDRAAGALSQLLTPFPFLFGERPGQADLFLFYNLDIAERVSRFVYQRSIIDEIGGLGRSEEHTSELQSLMRISYAVFCLKKKKNTQKQPYTTTL